MAGRRKRKATNNTEGDNIMRKNNGILILLFTCLFLFGGCALEADNTGNSAYAAEMAAELENNSGEIEEATETTLTAPTPAQTTELTEKPVENTITEAPEVEMLVGTSTPSTAVPTTEETPTEQITLPTEAPQNNVPDTFNSDLIVNFLDVGQADSILIQLPNNRVMLIDGGNSNDANTILSYMGSLNITTIDYLVATHPHADHIGGLSSIINNMNIGEIYMPRISHTSQTFAKLLDAIENKGLGINEAKAGVNILSVFDLHIDIIAPVRDDYSDLNDWSAAIKIIYKNNSFLFMGDTEALSESHITSDVSADVLKVGHHGAHTSTSQSFLNKVSPMYAVISVGKNSYGHPTDVILNRLNVAGVKVYRTDLQGTIIFTSNGNIITVNTEPTPYQPVPATTQAPTQPPTPAPTAPPIITTAPATTQEITEALTSASVMVWLSATGSKYHRINNCGNMNPSKARQVTLEEAKKNYTACANCKPPS